MTPSVKSDVIRVFKRRLQERYLGGNWVELSSPGRAWNYYYKGEPILNLTEANGRANPIGPKEDSLEFRKELQNLILEVNKESVNHIA